MSGAHTHDTSGEHIQNQIFYFLEARAYSRMIIYWYVGKDKFEVHSVKANSFAPLGKKLLKTDGLMLFKVPQGYEATLEITEVATGGHPHTQGRYLVTVQLHPYRGALADLARHADEFSNLIEAYDQQGVEPFDSGFPDDEIGICTAQPPHTSDCPGTYSPCLFGQVVRKVNGVCKCVNPQDGE